MKEVLTKSNNSEALRHTADKIRSVSGHILTNNSEALAWWHSYTTYYSSQMLGGSLLILLNSTVRSVFNNTPVRDIAPLSGAALTFSQFVPFRYLYKNEAPKKLVVSDSVGPAIANLLDKVADRLQK